MHSEMREEAAGKGRESGLDCEMEKCQAGTRTVFVKGSETLLTKAVCKPCGEIQYVIRIIV